MSNLFDVVNPGKRVAILPQEEGPVKPFTIDATVEENHLLSSQVTQFPIEDGSTISDHIIKKPFKLTMNCIVSDNPINSTDLIQSSALGLSSNLFGGTAVLGAGIAAKIGGDLLAKDRNKLSKNAKEMLEGFQKDGILLTISTSLEVYSNMLIENIAIPRTPQTALSLTFSIVLIQVTIVSKELVTVDLSTLDPEVEGAADEVNQGRQTATDVDGATDGKASLALQAFQVF